jgi:hypothetical protein
MDPNERGILCSVFYRFKLMVKIVKNWFEIQTPFFQDNIPEKWLIK